MIHFRLSHYIVGLLTVMIVSSSVIARDHTVRDDLNSIFERFNVQGAFVLLDVSRDHLTIVNPDRLHEQRFPASTFKIANSLIALEETVIRDENEIIPYGGQPQPFKSWEQDMSIRDAIRISNVPIYQELARRVGKERYELWLTQLDYGNGHVGNAVERFWLDGPLAISPHEQIEFLTRLAGRDLPASVRSQAIVRDILRLDTKADGATLYGKTGWALAPDPDVGWFVGWVEDGDDMFVFALTIDIDSKKDGRISRPLGEAFLSEFGIY